MHFEEFARKINNQSIFISIWFLRAHAQHIGLCYIDAI